MGKVKTFINEVRDELKKVIWPTKDATIGTTAVVIVICLIIAVYLGIVDYGLAALTHFIY